MSKTLTVTAQYSYQAWQTAHRVLRSNVQVLSYYENGESVTVGFQAVPEPRWPVALKYYSDTARDFRLAALKAVALRDITTAQDHAEQAQIFRTRATDARTGHVSNPRTLARKGF